MSTILIVEDDVIARTGLSALLQAHGYLTHEVADAAEAMDRFRFGLAPDAVLLDMILPGNDGWSFLSQRRQDKLLASVPVVIMTAIGIASEEWARSLGAVGLLRKPIDADRLLGTLACLEPS
jgi:CheY-like chemotaxis protein